MSEHEWFHENLTLYGAGLEADECLRLERHAAECAACAQELAQWRLFDQGLGRLCAAVHFPEDWNRRVLGKLHAGHKPRGRWPALARWAAAAAAVLFIGVLGAAVHSVAQLGFVAFPGGDRLHAEASLPTVLPVFGMEAEDRADPEVKVGFAYFDAQGTQSTNNLKQIGLAKHSVDGELYEMNKYRDFIRGQSHHGMNVSGVTQGGPADIQNSNTIDNFPPALALIVRAPDRVHTSVNGKLGKNEPEVAEAASRMDGAQKLLAGQFKPFGNVNRNLGVNGVVSGLTPAGTQTLDLNAPIKNSSHELGPPPTAGVQVPDGGKATIGGWAISAGDTDGVVSKRLEGLQQLQEGDMKHGLNMGVELSDGSVRTGLSAERKPEKVGQVFVSGSTVNGRGLPTGHYGDAKAPPASDLRVAERSLARTDIFNVEATKGGDKEGQKEEKAMRRVLSLEKLRSEAAKDSGGVLKASTEYYSLQAKRVEEIAKLSDLVKNQKSVAKAEDRGLKEKADPKSSASVDAAFLKALDKGPHVDMHSPLAFQQKPDPQVAQRKIIRSGDLEFEVEVFDNAVADITKLINAIPGAFVATINSEKLPNGKVKGSVVVRVPPEHLDKFVLDLRKDLAKTGELKSQRIGSQDVTKQYTDIESRLRAARTMEERMIAIIKNGKGDVKDLVAAEAQLGVWRTKIEEMEGEIRYYNNQVGLSSLTITAYEKEIRSAAAMVITEQVTMKIEADDVEKSLQTALSAVAEAKGRVTKSDLKQHAAGQLEAILQFEVSPAAADGVKDKLKALGVVTHHDSQRLQQAEGGTAPKGEPLKSRTNDVQYTVTLYNVANIQPREAYVLQVVVTDVPAEYRKLLESVDKAKGQIRVSQLDEKEKFNVFAQLDFDVPSKEREKLDQQLGNLGDTVARNTTRAGPGETATDRKVGYRLTLKSVTSVPPRETYTLNIYSLDVPVAYKALQVAAENMKGHVRALQLNEQDKNNINAQFDVDLPTPPGPALARGGAASEFDKLLDDMGDVASRSASRVQPSEIATELKVGYRLTLRSQVPPRETVALGLEVSDVNKVSANLAELVKSAKGKVTASQINKDATGRETAFQLFDVPLAAKDDLVKKFSAIAKSVRAQKATQNLQAPDGKLATAHIDVTLTNQAPIVPSDEGLAANVRNSLAYAFRLLSLSMIFVIVGISVILPWALVVWIGFKIVRRMSSKRQAAA